MLVGFCLFKLNDRGKLQDKNLYKQFDTPEEASNLLKLKSIHRFASTAEAVEDMSALQEGKLSKTLKRFLTEEIQGKAKGKEQTLLVSDPKLGGAISKKLSLKVVSDSSTQDLYRGIRSQLASLLGERNIDQADLGNMSLGLSHSLSRYRLKFSPDKVDTMVVQAIALLDDLDKELNIYAMRVKEWYGWHFPEMTKIVTDNIAYAKCIKAMGYRTDAAKTDFSAILPEDLEELLKAAAVISMGTEISFSDMTHIHLLCDQVIAIASYRAELSDYLRSRMHAIAPNMTVLLGELVGARLIAHSGSLLNLAKQPASTIQILGAEKALFRALKTKHDTPKYGLIFHASLVGQAPQQLKGKAARMVAAKTALAIRVDALTEEDISPAGGEPRTALAPTVGIEGRAKLEKRMRHLEQGLGITSVRKQAKLNGNVEQANKRFELKGNSAGYNTAVDALIPTAPPVASTSAATSAPAAVMDEDEDDEARRKREKKERKEAKRKRKEAEADASTTAGDTTVDVSQAVEDEAARKERKRLKKLAKQAAATASEVASLVADGTAKKRKSTDQPDTGEKKKKKKRHSDANGSQS